MRLLALRSSRHLLRTSFRVFNFPRQRRELQCSDFFSVLLVIWTDSSGAFRSARRSVSTLGRDLVLLTVAARHAVWNEMTRDEAMFFFSPLRNGPRSGCWCSFCVALPVTSLETASNIGRMSERHSWRRSYRRCKEGTCVCAFLRWAPTSANVVLSCTPTHRIRRKEVIAYSTYTSERQRMKNITTRIKSCRMLHRLAVGNGQALFNLQQHNKFTSQLLPFEAAVGARVRDEGTD